MGALCPLLPSDDEASKATTAEFDRAVIAMLEIIQAANLTV
jgi:hypothetical protein